MIRYYNICNVPINKIIHANKPAYVFEERAGKSIYHWPVYQFFKLYHSGEIDDAKSFFLKWYIDQYSKYAEIDKSKGGMKGGSLDRLVKKLPSQIVKENFLEKVILERVQQRFELFESIRSTGYIPNNDFPVKTIRTHNDKFKLLSGHHRTAILAALGYNSVPNVYVFANDIMLFGYRIESKIKQALELLSQLSKNNETNLYI